MVAGRGIKPRPPPGKGGKLSKLLPAFKFEFTSKMGAGRGVEPRNSADRAERDTRLPAIKFSLSLLSKHEHEHNRCRERQHDNNRRAQIEPACRSAPVLAPAAWASAEKETRPTVGADRPGITRPAAGTLREACAYLIAAYPLCLRMKKNTISASTISATT